MYKAFHIRFLQDTCKVMKMEYELKTGPQGHIYLPKRLREEFGRDLKLVPDTHVAILYPADSDLGKVIASLRIIMADLNLRRGSSKQP
jgi:hypothetical protein